MITRARRKLTAPTWLGCLYCGVDSGPVVSFFFWMIGAGLLGFFCVYAWGVLNGKFEDTDERASQLSIEAEYSEDKK